MDSGLRRNDGWGGRNDGECDRTPWIPAGAGMTVGEDGMTVGGGGVMEACGGMTGKIEPPAWKRWGLATGLLARGGRAVVWWVV